MNKPLVGLVVGGVVGAFDGLTALVSAPEVAPQIVGIIIGSTFKGVIVGLIAGFFARKVNSLPLGIAVGLAAGLLFAYLIASQPDPATGKHYYWEIMLPGSLAGAIVGYATQRYGRRPGQAAALLLAFTIASSPLAASAQTAAGSPTDPAAAFSRLKTLVGTWQGSHTTKDGPATVVEYSLTGGGSALVERLFAGSPHEMLSVYYMDGSDLVLTHYCAMGNQPRMRLVAGGKDGELRFDFVSGTNLDVATSTHIHGGRIAILGPDRFDADWYVWSKGQPLDTKQFFMSRAAAK